MSVIQAKSSIRVMPGSETLCSVHSGQARATRVRASFTRSWKRRSSRSTWGRLMDEPRGQAPVRRPGGFGMNLRPGPGPDVRASRRLLLGRDEIERVDEVAHVVGRADAVGDVDQQPALVALGEVEVDLEHLRPRLPPVERDAHVVVDPAERVAVDAGEHVIVDRAAELGPHRPLPRHRAEDDGDRLADVVVVADERQRALPVDPQGKGHAGTNEVAGRAHPREMDAPLTWTAPFAWTVMLAPLMVRSPVASMVSDEFALTVTFWPSYEASSEDFCSSLPPAEISRSASVSSVMLPPAWTVARLSDRSANDPSVWTRSEPGVSLPFQSAPSTYGRRTSPCSNATSTSSPATGIISRPRSLPAAGAAIRAHQPSMSSPSAG